LPKGKCGQYGRFHATGAKEEEVLAKTQRTRRSGAKKMVLAKAQRTRRVDAKKKDSRRDAKNAEEWRKEEGFTLRRRERGGYGAKKNGSR
jgi:hypothetical protein